MYVRFAPSGVHAGAPIGPLSFTIDAGVPPETIVAIAHTTPLTGGELGWPDARYRKLLLRAPRALWSADGIRLAASLVPGGCSQTT